MPSTDTLSPAQRATLLEVARQSIAHGLDAGRCRDLSAADFEPALRAPRASFITLTLNGDLRGCIGHLEAVQPLVVDVSDNAYAAAFRDPRFPPLRQAEWPGIALHLSVLTPAEPLPCTDEADLLRQIVPGRDGLILQEGANRGTFLPSVWDSLPEPAAFLAQLKRKAGLAPGHWSDEIRVFRYRTESFGDDDTA
jgi:AmmeMemoRadiSam system protein A